MVRILGLLDIFTALVLILLAKGFTIPLGLIIVLSLFLLLKSIPFLPDIGSIFDSGAVIILVAGIFINIPCLILFVFSGLLGLKGIMSLFA